MLAVTRDEVEREIRPSSRTKHEAVLCPRYFSVARPSCSRKAKIPPNVYALSPAFPAFRPCNPYKLLSSRCVVMDRKNPETKTYDCASHPTIDSVEEWIEV